MLHRNINSEITMWFVTNNRLQFFEGGIHSLIKINKSINHIEINSVLFTKKNNIYQATILKICPNSKYAAKNNQKPQESELK